LLPYIQMQDGNSAGIVSHDAIWQAEG